MIDKKAKLHRFMLTEKWALLSKGLTLNELLKLLSRVIEKEFVLKFSLRLNVIQDFNCLRHW